MEVDLAKSVATCIAAGVAASCALPGVEYPVVPAISGVVRENGEPLADGQVVRGFRSHDNPCLGGSDTAPIRPDGTFEFEEGSLKVAGKEFGKEYFVNLCLETDLGFERLWSTTYSRMQMPPPVSLICELPPEPDHLPCRAAE